MTPPRTTHYTPRTARAGVWLVMAAVVLAVGALISTVAAPPLLNGAVPFVWGGVYLLGVAGLVTLALSGLLIAAIRLAWQHTRGHRGL